LRQAVVDPDLCTACGICEGSCPSATPFRNVEELVSGIEMPGYPLDALRQQTAQALAGARDAIFVFGCDRALEVAGLRGDGLRAVSLPCIGMLPPSFADYVARQANVAGVLVTGCHPEDCFYRKGSQWTAERFAGERMPHLRTTAGKNKVRIHWAGPHDGAALARAIETFRDELAGVQA
jgi:coenzyme F420-reducing hydrogenase delta subunit